VECLDTRDGGRGVLSLDSNHMNIIIDFAATLLNSSCNDASTTWNVKR